MSVRTLTPAETQKLVRDGAVLVDVREPDERAREKIAGSEPLPLSRLDAAPPAWRGKTVIFHCRSGARTLGNAARLAATLGEGGEPCVMAGGLDAWKKAGLPVETDRRQPLELQRQVQIGAGSLAFFGTLLGLIASPWFFAVPLFVGAGLMVAGITGFCGMARLLVHAPWNRAAYAPGDGKTA